MKTQTKKRQYLTTTLILIAITAGFYAGYIGFGYTATQPTPTATPAGQYTLKLQGNTFYVDPVNGSMGNDGSHDNPWSTLQAVFANGLIGTTVQPGDTILLRDGYHGEIDYGRYDDAHNADYITISAQAGHTPELKRFWLRNASKWIIRGLTISPECAPEYKGLGVSGILRLESSEDIIIEDNNIFSVQDASSWSEDDWINKASAGMSIQSTNTIIRNNTIKNVQTGIAGCGQNSLIEDNEIQHIVGDGIVTGADDITIQYNTLKNFYSLVGHPDGIQFVRATDIGSSFYNVVIRGNFIISYEPGLNPLLDGANGPQGIVNFSGPSVNWLVENNVVLVRHSHGISLSGRGGGAIDSTVVNNIALDPTGVLTAWIAISSSAQNTVVRNNMSRSLPSSNPSQNVVVENNIDIDDYGPNVLFVDHENNDVRHKLSSPAIGAGNCESAPSEDILGNPRPTDTGCDIGPYEFVTVSCSTDSDCDSLDSLPCVDYVCDSGNTNNCVLSDTDGIPCNDNDACTLNDTCLNNTCTGTPLNCNDSVDCTVDICIDSVCQNAPNDGKCLEGFPLCTSAKCDPIQGCTDYQPSGCNIPSDLVLWMTFNEGSGSIATDSSESKNEGTLHNEPLWSTDCPEGNCLLFDGIDDYVEVQDSDSLASNNSEMTWSWWAKPLSLSSNRGLFSKYSIGGDQRSYLIYVYSGANKQARANISNDGTNNSGHIGNSITPANYLILDDEWHYYAITFNSGAVKFYRDGSEFHSDNMGIGTIYNSTAPLLIGKWTYSWDGVLDEIRIYNKALNSQQIQAIYNETTECVDTPALMNYIGQWKQGQITMLTLMQKIGKWKSGEGCS